MKKLIALLALVSTPALAHHPLAGAPMETFTHGLLSGVGHPLLGFDHLFFVVAVGIAAVFTGRALSVPLGYIAGMLGGVALILGGVALPAVEIVIALSLLVVGGVILAGRSLSATLAVSLFAVLGLFHGWAFGGSIVGQEAISATVVTGYLIGLAAIQYLVAIASGATVRRLWNATTAQDLAPRLAGAAVAGAGLFLTLEAAEGVAFAALGLGLG